MTGRKNIRTRGKISLGKYFQNFKKGDSVAVTLDVSLNPKFPKKLQGRSGLIEGKKGKAYIVKIKDQSKEKEYLIEAIHLKKLKKVE